jgi:hypothetical protein
MHPGTVAANCLMVPLALLTDQATPLSLPSGCTSTPLAAASETMMASMNIRCNWILYMSQVGERD